MKFTALEYGTFWLAAAANSPYPIIPARVHTSFREIGLVDLAPLQIAMEYATPEAIHDRLQTGRRCFGLILNGRIISYGWVSFGMESVGELERVFHFREDEVYVWHCGTIPEYRGNLCYTSLLSHLIHQFHGEGMRRVWIGASRKNKPSVQGILRAGFQHIVDMTYRRFGLLKLIRFYPSAEALPADLTASYRILINPTEKRLGTIAFGFYQDRNVLS